MTLQVEIDPSGICLEGRQAGLRQFGGRLDDRASGEPHISGVISSEGFMPHCAERDDQDGIRMDLARAPTPGGQFGPVGGIA